MMKQTTTNNKKILIQVIFNIMISFIINSSSLAQYNSPHICKNKTYLCEYEQKNYQSNQKYLEWLKKSARNGNSDAEFRLGKYYFFGNKTIHIKRNINLGLFYLQQSSLHNHELAQAALGIIYQGKKGIPENIELSQKYFKLACKNGLRSVCSNIQK